MNFRVLEVDHDSSHGLSFGYRSDLHPRRSEVLIDVHYVSLNFGEVNRAVRKVEESGSVLGWDAAGVVLDVGVDVTAFRPGDRVVTRAPSGGWAEQRVADVADTALVPETVDLAVASTLPTAAATALHALGAYGSLLGKTVLVTGASGGVGRFVIQLAKLGGARVAAVSGSHEHRQELVDLGADIVATDLVDFPEEVDLVIESVGGELLSRSVSLLRGGGHLVSIGCTSGMNSTFEPYALIKVQRNLHGFRIGDHAVGKAMETLLALVGDGKLSTGIKWQDSWENISAAIDLSSRRELSGKAVLTVKEE